MLFNPAIYNITQTIVGGGGGGSSFLDSEGLVFMTADEEAFCVDGNDRLFDVEKIPENPNENLVYKKTEKTTTSDGQLTYINETTTYGIPVQTDHSNGLHYKNVEVLQYMGEGNNPHVYIRFTLDQTAMDLIEFFVGMGAGGLYRGYKVIENISEFDSADRKYIYLVRSTNEIVRYQNGWTIQQAEQVNDPSEMTGLYGIYYGKESGWRSLSELAEYETKYFETLQTISSLLDKSITEIECSTQRLKSSAFLNCRKLKTAKIYTSIIDEGAFDGCNSLTTLITTANFIRDVPEELFCCLVLLALEVSNKDDTYTANNVFMGCYHFNGTVNDTYNPNGLKDGYIYVPLSLIDAYKTNAFWIPIASQIMPIVKDINELYKLDTSIYTIAYVASVEMEVKYDGTWKSLR